jgi:hypothetical protein
MGTDRRFLASYEMYTQATVRGGRRREDDMTGTLASPAALTAADRCDRCGAAAAVRAVLPKGGELLFCSHHAREHSARLEELAADIYRAQN